MSYSDIQIDDLERSRESCLRNHTILAVERSLCNWRGGKDHVWLVREGQQPVKGQTCCCEGKQA